jgi:hypothetical protein
MAHILAGLYVIVAGVAALSVHAHAQESPMKIAPLANMTRVGSIDERYQSLGLSVFIRTCFRRPLLGRHALIHDLHTVKIVTQREACVGNVGLAVAGSA